MSVSMLRACLHRVLSDRGMILMFIDNKSRSIHRNERKKETVAAPDTVAAPAPSAATPPPAAIGD